MKPSVTVLGGFLGAGKTTLLRHLLSQSAGRRWAVVVNDLAALNIDGVRLRDGAPAGSEVVELAGGCVCCSGRDELGERVARLVSEGVYDHILIETTGVAEPRGVVTLFTRKNPFGRTLSDFATLSSLVTVLDAAFFFAQWREYHGAAPRRQWASPSKESPALALMIEQAECADLVVLNHRDRVESSGRGDVVQVIEEIVRGLNPRAEILWSEHGRLDASDVIDRVRFDAGATVGGARWIRELNALPPLKTFSPVVRPAVVQPGARHGFSCVVYRERRPFDRDRLLALLEQGLPGVLRAKGFFWTREQPDEMGFLSVAGGVASQEMLNYWWASLVEQGKATLAERPPSVVAAWSEPHGDRRQEIVLIGPELDEAALVAALDAALTPA